MWVFIPTSDGRWAVGFFTPSGTWQAEGNAHSNKDNAASRVNYLNGGPDENRIQELRNAIIELGDIISKHRL